jgi:hypothetical protein
MTTPEQLGALELIAHRSPEGVGVPLSTAKEAGASDAVLAALEAEGLIERCNGDTIVITEAGWSVLHPRRAL